MKKLHLLFAGAFAALALVACSDDELETETKTEPDTETEEGGTGDENTGEETTGDDEEEAPQAYITLSAAELQFARTGGEATVTVDANYDWVCECDSDWFTVVADTNAGTLTVTCDDNGTGEVREGAVTVTASDGEDNVAEATLTITQSIYEANALVLEYTITSDNTTIQLPLGEEDYDENKYDIDCTVDWGDGSEVETVTGSFPSHTYSAGTYTVIINGKVELLCGYDYDTWYDIKGVECLTAVRQWGDLGLKSMDSAFQDCTNLASLPEGAGPFSNVTSFFWAFCGCTSLTTVPEDIFSNCAAAEYFDCVFDSCYNLTSAPSFKGLSNATGFIDAFYRCESLTTVPEDMFSGCTAAENLEYVFNFCYNLTSAPSFKGLSNATDFYCAFWDCTSLTTIPEDMFSGCTAVVDFGYTFCDCIPLTSVPANLFADSPLVEYFDGVFSWCTSLETVPVGIFDNNKSVTYFDYAFYDCTKLVGESPYTMIDEEKVHLYERENYPEYFTVPTRYSDCFTGCTGLDDYYSIPYSWGGPETAHPPVSRMSLNSTDRETLRSSRLGTQRATKGLHRDAATPQAPAARPLPTRK